MRIQNLGTAVLLTLSATVDAVAKPKPASGIGPASTTPSVPVSWPDIEKGTLNAQVRNARRAKLGWRISSLWDGDDDQVSNDREKREPRTVDPNLEPANLFSEDNGVEGAAENDHSQDLNLSGVKRVQTRSAWVKRSSEPSLEPKKAKPSSDIEYQDVIHEVDDDLSNHSDDPTWAKGRRDPEFRARSPSGGPVLNGGLGNWAQASHGHDHHGGHMQRWEDENYHGPHDGELPIDDWPAIGWQRDHSKAKAKTLGKGSTFKSDVTKRDTEIHTNEIVAREALATGELCKAIAVTIGAGNVSPPDQQWYSEHCKKKRDLGEEHEHTKRKYWLDQYCDDIGKMIEEGKAPKGDILYYNSDCKGKRGLEEEHEHVKRKYWLDQYCDYIGKMIEQGKAPKGDILYYNSDCKGKRGLEEEHEHAKRKYWLDQYCDDIGKMIKEGKAPKGDTLYYNNDCKGKRNIEAREPEPQGMFVSDGGIHARGPQTHPEDSVTGTGKPEVKETAGTGVNENTITVVVPFQSAFQRRGKHQNRPKVRPHLFHDACEGSENLCTGDVTHCDGSLGAWGWNVDNSSDMQIALPFALMGGRLIRLIAEEDGVVSMELGWAILMYATFQSSIQFRSVLMQNTSDPQDPPLFGTSGSLVYVASYTACQDQTPTTLPLTPSVYGAPGTR